MVGVMVRDEYVPQRRELQSRDDELPRHAVAAVHDVQLAPGDDDLSRRHAADARTRTASGAEQYETRAVGACEPAWANQRGRTECRALREKETAVHVNLRLQ
jgi:hypothetical protein